MSWKSKEGSEHKLYQCQVLDCQGVGEAFSIGASFVDGSGKTCTCATRSGVSSRCSQPPRIPTSTTRFSMRVSSSLLSCIWSINNIIQKAQTARMSSPLFFLRPPFVKLRLYVLHGLLQITHTVLQLLYSIIDIVPSLCLVARGAPGFSNNQCRGYWK